MAGIARPAAGTTASGGRARRTLTPPRQNNLLQKDFIDNQPLHNTIFPTRLLFFHGLMNAVRVARLGREICWDLHPLRRRLVGQANARHSNAAPRSGCTLEIHRAAGRRRLPNPCYSTDDPIILPGVLKERGPRAHAGRSRSGSGPGMLTRTTPLCLETSGNDPLPGLLDAGVGTRAT